MTWQSPRYWDDLAAAFDDEPDHGLRDPAVRAAWLTRLAIWLPASGATVLDVGVAPGRSASYWRRWAMLWSAPIGRRPCWPGP